MGRIMGRHSAVLMLHEVHFFEELWDPSEGNASLDKSDAILLASRLIGTQREGYLSDIRDNRHHEEAIKIIERLGNDKPTPTRMFEEFLSYEGQRVGATVICEQTPRNLYYVDEILSLYPEAKIIEMIRDPRDVLVSMKHKWRRRHLAEGNYPLKAAFRSWTNYHPILISRIWKGAAREGRCLSRSARVLRAHYEELVSNPETEIRRICEMSGLEFEEDMLNVRHIGSSTSSDVGETGLSSSSIGGWKKGGLSRTELWLCQKIAGGEMQAAGYELKVVQLPLLGLVLSAISLPFKVLLALIMNFNRTRNIRHYIKRRLRT